MHETSERLLLEPRSGRAASKAQPPTYAEIGVALQVGGRRWPTWPVGEAVLSGRGLSVDDLRLALDRLHAAGTTGERPLFGRLSMWPALDAFEHPDPAAVWSLVRRAEIGNAAFHRANESRLVPTDGRRIGSDPDWRRVLDDARAAGLRHVWFTFLGLQPTHDALCERSGAFQAVVSAMQRCAAVGLKTGANIVVSKRNVGDIGALGALVRSLGGEQLVPTYVQPWTTAASYEAVRPDADDVRGLPPAGLGVNRGYRTFWADPAAHTEGALTREALESAGSGLDAADHQPSLLVTPELDLLSGVLSVSDEPVQRIANLRDDEPEEVGRRIAALEPPREPPADAALAARYGDPDGRKLFMSVHGLRRKWLAAWRSET